MSEDMSHEMLIMWMDLNRAVAAARRSATKDEAVEILPWSSSDPNVKVAWEKLTRVENLRALEEWLEVASRDKSRLWTERAIIECKQRAS